jgi:hypothetical protein
MRTPPPQTAQCCAIALSDEMVDAGLYRPPASNLAGPGVLLLTNY